MRQDPPFNDRLICDDSVQRLMCYYIKALLLTERGRIMGLATLLINPFTLLIASTLSSAISSYDRSCFFPFN